MEEDETGAVNARLEPRGGQGSALASGSGYAAIGNDS